MKLVIKYSAINRFKTRWRQFKTWGARKRILYKLCKKWLKLCTYI